MGGPGRPGGSADCHVSLHSVQLSSTGHRLRLAKHVELPVRATSEQIVHYSVRRNRHSTRQCVAMQGNRARVSGRVTSAEELRRIAGESSRSCTRSSEMLGARRKQLARHAMPRLLKLLRFLQQVCKPCLIPFSACHSKSSTHSALPAHTTAPLRRACSRQSPADPGAGSWRRSKRVPSCPS